MIEWLAKGFKANWQAKVKKLEHLKNLDGKNVWCKIFIYRG